MWNFWKRLRSALSALFHGARFRRELDEEMAFHIEKLTEDLIESGMDPGEARREARRRFGAPEEVQYRSRQARGVAVLDEIARDVRFALRSMSRNPLFTATFVVTLGLCIGAGTAVYSAADAVLWRPLPYPDADRLALVTQYDPAAQTPEAGVTSLTGAQWERLRDAAESLQLAIFSGWRGGGVNLSAENAAAFVHQQRVSAGFFETLGVSPLLGREFTEAEDVPDGPAVAILSHGLWQRTFHGDREIVGGTIRLKGAAHTVVGVMPDGFESNIPADLWTPIRAHRYGEGGGANYTVLARIPSEMSRAEANARLSALEAGPRTSPDGPTQRFGLVPLDRALGADMRQPLLLLLGAILAMLLVGCANLAGLQVARALARRSEIATRQALGAGAGAITRQMLIENLMLGLAGGVAGIGIAYASVGGLEALMQAHFGTWQPIRLDGRALAAGFGLTLVATLLFGLAPALQARGFDMRRVLGTAGRGSVGGGGQRLRKVLLVGEVAVVTALLFGAGLMARSYGHLAGMDPGFDPDGVLTVQLSLDDARFDEAEDINRFFDQTLTRIRRIQGVSSAAVSLTLPYERALNMPFQIPEIDTDRNRIANVVYVTPEFFETVNIPLLRGRALEAADRAGAPPVVVANRAFVDQHLADSPTVGARLSFAGRDWQVVGVVGDVLQQAGWGPSQPVWRTPTLYMSPAQAGDGFYNTIHVWFAPSWLVKTDARAPDLAAEITGALHEVNADVPVARIASLNDVMRGALAEPRFQALFLIAVAGFALLLAVVGLYGIVANEVVQRTPEMGLRMALGATPRRAMWTAGVSGVWLTLVGLLVGGVLAVFGARWLEHVIWGVAPWDPLTLGFVVLCLVVLAATASFVPAARIARLDPARILRAE